MRATGIVRRIDDLGQVVIPKEIRRSLHIREGDPLEIYTGNDMVCFKKYSPMGEHIDYIKNCSIALQGANVTNAWYDRDERLAGYKNFPAKAPDVDFERDPFEESGKTFYPIWANDDFIGFVAVDPKDAKEKDEFVRTVIRIFTSLIEN